MPGGEWEPVALVIAVEPGAQGGGVIAKGLWGTTAAAFTVPAPRCTPFTAPLTTRTVLPGAGSRPALAAQARGSCAATGPLSSPQAAADRRVTQPMPPNDEPSRSVRASGSYPAFAAIAKGLTTPFKGCVRCRARLTAAGVADAGPIGSASRGCLAWDRQAGDDTPKRKQPPPPAPAVTSSEDPDPLWVPSPLLEPLASLLRHLKRPASSSDARPECRLLCPAGS